GGYGGASGSGWDAGGWGGAAGDAAADAVGGPAQGGAGVGSVPDSSEASAPDSPPTHDAAAPIAPRSRGSTAGTGRPAPWRGGGGVGIGCGRFGRWSTIQRWVAGCDGGIRGSGGEWYRGQRRRRIVGRQRRCERRSH